MDIQTTLRTYRKAMGLTQQELADAASLHRNTYLNYELGKRTPPYSVVRKLAGILGAAPEILWPDPVAGTGGCTRLTISSGDI